MKKMKKLICVITALALLIPAAATAQGSWGQINQSLERGENWKRIVQNPEEFQLGEPKPMEGQEGLYIGDWGTYPPMDGSTVCPALPSVFSTNRITSSTASSEVRMFSSPTTRSPA